MRPFLFPVYSCLFAIANVLATPASAQWATGGTMMNAGAENPATFVADGSGGVRQFSIAGSEVVGSAISVDGRVSWVYGYGGGIFYPYALTAVGDGSKNHLCADSDGLGGNVFAWYDLRSSGPGIYAQRVDAGGNALWTANGVSVILTNKAGGEIAICPDGSGGAFVAYQPRVGSLTPQYPVRVQHLLANGSLAWAGGIAVTNIAGSTSSEIRLMSDLHQGAIVMWRDLSMDGGAGEMLAQRVNAAGSLLWGATGIGVATQAGLPEHDARMIPDDLGGAYVVWEDARLGYSAIFGEHISANGLAHWWYPGYGVQLSTGESYRPVIAKDPITSDLLVAYVHPGAWGSPSYPAHLRFSPNGYLVRAEATLGVTYCDTLAIAADGIGGMVLACKEAYDGVFMYRIAQDGTTGFYQVRLGGLPGGTPFVVGDGRGGGVAAWDGPSYYGTPLTVRAGRVTLTGTPGPLLPRITDVADVYNDEGGFVHVQLAAAGADELAPNDSTFVLSYGLWRRLEPGGFAPAAALEPGDVADPRALAARMAAGAVRLQPGAAALIGLPPGTWESLGLYPAAGMPTYSLLAPTRQDSSSSNWHTEVFAVSAHTATPRLAGASFADSGRSVDNLAPPAPTSLAGTYGGGALHLSWAPSGATDLQRYAVYRGPSAGFVPSPATRVGYAGGTAFDDGAFVNGSHYKVTAIDRHDNESGWASLAPGQIADVPGAGIPEVSFLAPVQPNPMRGAVVLAFGLARAGVANLVVFDLAGRRVRMLAQGPREAGEYRLPWDGRDDDGRPLPGGLYWLRLEAPGIQASRKVVLAL